MARASKARTSSSTGAIGSKSPTAMASSVSQPEASRRIALLQRHGGIQQMAPIAQQGLADGVSWRDGRAGPEYAHAQVLFQFCTA